MEDRTLLATMLWANDANGDWNVAANWVNESNPLDQHIPTASDNAEINFSDITVTYASGSDAVNSLASAANLDMSGGTLSIASSSTISANLVMTGGTLTGAGTLSVAGATSWTGGTMSGSGVTNADGGLVIGGAEGLTGRTLQNNGVATLSSPSPDSPFGLSISNATLINAPGASFSVTTDTSIYGNGGGIFLNEGTFAKTGGTNSPVSITFNQTGSGTLQVESGTLVLSDGGTFSGTAATAIGVGSGTALEFDTGTFTIASSMTIADSGAVIVFTPVNVNASLGVTGSGVVNIIGTLTLNADASFPALNLSGTLTGPGNLTVTGATTWTHGMMSGSGVTNADGGLVIGGAEGLTGRTLQNNGVATLSSPSPDSPFGLSISNATLINAPGASFSVTTDTSIYGNGGGIFLNEGTFAKTGGTNSPVSVAFNQSNTGVLEVQSGTLQLSGSFANFSAGTLSGGQYIVEGTLQFNNAAITTTTAGITLDGPSSRIIDQSGNDAMANFANVAAGGGFSILDGRNFTTAASLSNAGTLTVGSGSTLTLGGGYDQTGGQTNVLGTLANSPAPPTTNALSFNGVNDYVQVPTGFANFTGGMTVEVWAYPTASGSWQRFLDLGNGAADDNIIFERSGTSNNLEFNVWQGGTSVGVVIAPNAIQLNQWQFFAATFDAAGNVTLYKNGIEIASGTTPLPNDVVRTSNFIGRSNWAADSYYQGKMNDVGIWTNARSEAQILSDMNKVPTANDPGLLAYWQFNEGSGTIAHDESANHNDATLGGAGAADAPSWVSITALTPPDPGNALSFNGIQDYASVSDQPSLRLTNTVTIEFWAKRERFGLDIVLEKGGDWTEGETDYGVGFHSVNNDMFYFYFAGGWRGTSGVTDFGWHYYAVVATQGAANPEFYIDGAAETVQYSGGAGTIDLNPSTNPLYLGAQIDPVYTYYGNTVLDDVSIWNTALSQSAIQTDMNQTLTGAEPGLVADWQFNEGSGNIAHDLSANHNDAILGGGVAADAPSWVPSSPTGVYIEGGALAGSGTIDANVLNAGLLQADPPDGTGILTINGNYTQASGGTLDVNIGGATAGTQFDSLDVTGQASLDGTLEVNLINGYFPPSGASFRVLNYGSGSGDFAVETGLFLGGGEGLDPTYDSSGLNLVVIPEQLATTLSLSPSVNPSTFGQFVTFTATVATAQSFGFTPTGTVTFYDDGSILGSSSLSGGTSSVTTSALGPGSNAIVAIYSGDPNFSGSNSSTLAQIVNQDTTTTTIAGSLNPSVYGESVTFTATVSASAPGSGTPTGTVTFWDGLVSLGMALLNNGTASISTSILAAGINSITASYGGDADFIASDSPALSQTINQDSVTTTLNTSTANPSVFGQPVTVTAAISPVSPGGGVPTGTVTFYDGSTALGTTGLSSGSASFSTSTLSVGSHSITATYSGDTNFQSGSSTPLAQTVNQDGSVTAVTSSLNPAIISQSVTFTVAVSALSPGSGTPTGTAAFYDGPTAIGTENLINGSAALTTSVPSLGNHSITVRYNGDTDFTGSTSTAITQTIKQASSTAVVSSSVNPSVFGQSVTFTTTVAALPPSSGTPTGTATFYDGSTAIGTETLVNGSASYSTSALTVGSHSITVQYNGDSNFIASTSSALTQSIGQDGTHTTVVSSLNPSIVNEPVSFTATVSASSPGTGSPTGTVTFYDGLTAIGTVALSGGSASFTAATLAVADHSITAVYSGDSDFSSSTSVALSQVVQQPATATLNGEVYNDLNGNGSLEGGEPGLPGWTVQLLSTSNTVVATTTTNSSGIYSFSGVEPGTYTVAPTEPSGYVPSGPASGTITATAAAGQTISNLNFGEFQTATFSGELFEDNNQNGLVDPGELGLSGWIVNLLNGSSQVISTATTDGSGNYSFANIAPGSYTITDILQPGYIATTPATGGFSFTPTSGAQVTEENFGVFKAVSLAVIGLATAPTGLQSSQNIEVEWTDTNTGTIPVTGSFADLLTITNATTGSILATASVSYDATTRGNLAAGSSTLQEYAYQLPDGSAGVGQIQFTVTADSNDHVSTAQNDPGKTATLVESSALAPYPDIAVTAVSSPVDAWSGRGIVVTWTVANQGQAVTQGTWNDIVYLKQVNSSGLGRELGVFQSAENLSPDQTYQRSQDFTLPQGISGSYEIIVTSDADGSVYDPNPANNTGTSVAFPIQLTPSPDLQVTSITVPPTATDFQPVTISWTVTNNGKGGTNTPSWNDEVYLSRDQTLSNDDILIGTVQNPSALAPGESYTQSLTATIQGTYEGPYFAIVVTDSNQVQPEYPFNNDNVTASTSVVEVQNVPSPGFLSATQVSVFPSPPSVIHGGDYLTVNWTVQDTGAGVVSVGSNDVLRTYLGGGVVKDQFGTETSIHDAVNYTLEYFPPVQPVASPDSSSGGAAIPGYWIVNDPSIGVVNQKVIQQGQFASQPGLLLPAWIDAVYLSQTPYVQTGAVPVAYQDDYSDPVQQATLSIGNSYSQSDTIQLPAHMSGTWYVVVVPNIFGTATAAPAQTSDEGSVAIPITAIPAPQLQVNSVTAPSTGVSGQSVPVTWTVSNQGFASTDAGMSQQPGSGSGPPTSSQWTDAVYLSTSTSLVTNGTGAATLLGTFQHTGNLNVLQSYTETQQITLPSNIQGKFTIFVEADSTNNIFEASDTYGSPPVAVTNYDPTPINITSPPPADLQVTSIAAPSTAASGLPVSIGWTVTNIGSGTTSTNSWSDQLVLSADDDVTTTNDNIILGTFTHTGSLDSGSQYTTAGTVTLPVGISGTYYLFVTADTYNVAAGLSGEFNNFASVDLPITLTPSPHLQVTNFQVAGAALSGQPLPLDWTVTNTGSGPTRPTEASWTDSIYLSANGVFDPAMNVALGSFTHNGGLASGASYTQSQSIPLPIGISGSYTLFLVVDSLDQVYQSGVTIDLQSLPISITLSPPPDLEVSNVTAPTATYTDQNVTVNWMVSNQGTGPAAPATWDDSVYLSTDQFLTTTSAIFLGSVQHTGGLANGDTYSASLTAQIPDYASGPYYAFVVTDSGNLVFEATPSGSHQAYDPTALLVTMAPPSDLTVTAVSVPATGIVGQLTSAPISWTVANIGSNPAVGDWADNLYLSTDGTWSSSDPLVGQFFHYGDLAPGDSYTVTTAVAMPGVLPGNYFIIVRTDALDNERDANRSNNQLSSATTIDITIPTLQLGQTTTTTFGPPYDLYYEFTAQAGQTIDISGNVLSDSTQYEFFIRYGAPPTFDQFDQEYPYSFDTQQQLRIQNAQQGTYYVLFHDLSTAPAPTTLAISSKIETFEVDSVSPAVGSNVGSATVTITGAEFTPGAVVSLIGSDGTTRIASQVLWKDSGTLWATFDLTGLATGSYDVSVVDGAQTVTDPNTFTVTDGPAGSISIHILVPSSLRYISATPAFAEAEVVYSNPGDTDVSAPLLSLSASTGTDRIVELRLPGQTSLGTNAVQFLALNTEGPAGIIPPRSSFTYTIDFSFSETGLVTSATVDWSVGEAPTATQIDWPSQSAGLQLPTIPNAAWPAVFANFVASVGPTWGTYVAALANDATYLSQLGTYNETLNQLLSFELEKANAAFSAQSLVSVTADSLTAPGMDLTFTQSFLQSIAGRYTQGIMGYGWTDNWDIYAIKTANSDVAIYNAGVTLFYTLQTDGSYTDEAGDHSTLTLANGAYQLLTTSGMLYQFNANGTLNYVADANDNRITAGYNLAGQLVSLTDSNGEHITLTYNADGDLAELTDSNGLTEAYGYDPTGQYLTSYTDMYGTTEYAYITGQSAQRNNALAQVTYADNTSMNFTYDFEGRLIDQYRNGDAENESYTYLNPAGYTMTDANGNTSTILFNIYGATSETITPLGIVVSYKYDSNLNLIEVDGPQGAKYTGTYDANGNLTAVTDPLGQTTLFSYDGNSNLISYTDAKGNVTSYLYNSSNDLLSITYANGTQQRYTYNPLGEATQYLDAGGQAIAYTYNNAGLVTQETFPDGTSYSFTYDNLGDLASATDGQGNVTMFLYRDTANPTLLTKVEYPDGTYLEFTYNIIGQRTGSVDQTGFTVNYLYDSVGRLSELTDGSGNLIVRYSYDSAGNLVEKENGNGTFTIYNYDGDGDVLSITNYAPARGATNYVIANSMINSFDDYTYDALGNVLTDTSADGEWVYTYDADSELVGAVFTPNATDPDGLTAQNIQYVYDAVGNRISETVNGVVTTYVVNNMNEYTSSTTSGLTTSYQYDADGNLIAQSNSSGTMSYTFNILNELTGVAGPGLTATYGYSPLGELDSQTVNGVTTTYQVDPNGLGNVVAEFGNDGSLIAHFIDGLGLVSQVNANGSADYYDFNIIGSTIGITGSSGSYVNKYAYLPTGQTTILTATLANPFIFVGRSGQLTLGPGIVGMRLRVYSTDLGRFLSMDPTGIEGGCNLYQYVGNNSVDHIDPYGTEGMSVLPCVGYTTPFPAPFPAPFSTPSPFPSFSPPRSPNPSPGPTPSVDDFGILDVLLDSLEGALTAFAFWVDVTAETVPFLNPDTYDFHAPRPDLHGDPSNSVSGATPGGACPCQCPPSSPPKPPASPPVATGTTGIIGSHDPNSLTGPAAYGAQNFVPGGTPLPYTIDFENEPTATAPAQSITISEQLSANFDWRTFELGQISFGSETITVPDGLSFYATQVSVIINGAALLVRIDAGIDPTTGIVTWTLTSLDPTTGEPPTNPSIGLLPPDDANGDGEGFVTYTIQPLTGLPTGTTITSQASVIFDSNPSLSTNSVTDTLDALAPTSTVAPLPATEDDHNFTVSWSGQDDANGSGLASYSIYVSVNGGQFVPWLSDTTSASATYNGQPGNTYAFYSVATDNAGNVEGAPTTAEASTSVPSPLTITSIDSVAPNPRSSSVATIEVTFSEPINASSFTGGTLTLTNGSGTNLINSGVTLSLVSGDTYAIGNLSGLTQSQGLYTLTVNAAGISDENGVNGSGSLSTSWLIDTTPPTSSVTIPALASSLTFPITLAGTLPAEPTGSPPVDIASFSVYVSTNGGSWTYWKSFAPSGAAPDSVTTTFTGTSNTIYAFYVTATDNAGNTQAYSPKAEASIDLPELNTPVTHVSSSSTYNADGTFTLNLTGTDTGGNGLVYFELFVSIDGQTPVLAVPAIPAGVADSTGTYHVTVSYGIPYANYGTTPHSYQFTTVGIDAAGLIEPAHSLTDATFSESYAEPTASQLAVSNLTVEHGAAERSFVQYLDFNFNDANPSVLQAIVNSVNNPTADNPAELTLTQYSLTGTGPGTTIPLKGLLAVIDNAIEVNFGANGIGGNASSTTADGYYALAFTPKDSEPGVGSTHHFYRLLGDVLGTGTVTQLDLTDIAAARNESLSVIAAAIDEAISSLTPLSMDVDGNGTVNNTDLALATKSKGRSLGSGLNLG